MNAANALFIVHLVYSGVLLVLGLAAGSFLNVVVYRLPLGMSLVHPPSACPSCGKRIAARDNIPLFGWLLLGGKCRNCRAPISWRYPAVEALTGLLWAVEGWRLAGFSYGRLPNVCLGLLELLFISAMIATVFIDWDHRIIPDEISLGGTVLALAASPFLPAMHGAQTREAYLARTPELYLLFRDYQPWARSLIASFCGAAVGVGLLLVIYYLGNIAFRRQIERAKQEDPEIDSAIGLGDVKLMGLFGAFLGWRGAFLAFFAGSLLAALTGSAMKLASGDSGAAAGWAGLKNRWRSGNSVLPFGPFLVAGAFLALFFGESATHLLMGAAGR